MKKFLEESEKEELCGRVKTRQQEKRSDDGAHTETRGLLRDILEGEGPD